MAWPPYDEPVDDAWARVERVAADRESGAAQIARRAAVALGDLPSERLWAAIDLLLHRHPSMAPLWRLANDVLAALDTADGRDMAEEVATAPAATARAASAFLILLDSDRGAAAAAAAVLPDRVLTLSYSSTVVEAIRLRRPQQTVCMRSEPGGEGWRVAEETRDCTWPVVMEDEEAIEKLPCDAILVGADAVTPGGAVNKVKTRALAEAGRARAIPRYAVAGEAKFIGTALPLRPPFESTPLELFTSVAVPGSLYGPDEARVHAKAIILHPTLERLLERIAG